MMGGFLFLRREFGIERVPGVFVLFLVCEGLRRCQAAQRRVAPSLLNPRPTHPKGAAWCPWRPEFHLPLGSSRSACFWPRLPSPLPKKCTPCYRFPRCKTSRRLLWLTRERKTIKLCLLAHLFVRGHHTHSHTGTGERTQKYGHHGLFDSLLDCSDTVFLDRCKEWTDSSYRRLSWFAFRSWRTLARCLRRRLNAQTRVTLHAWQK